MSDKYIIKNCPVCEFSDWEECTGYLAEGYICNDIHTEIVECQDRTDCIIKQIITECRDAKIRANDYARNPYSGGIYDEANRILDFLDIQEVE
jgi:hypothetical protein